MFMMLYMLLSILVLFFSSRLLTFLFIIELYIMLCICAGKSFLCIRYRQGYVQ